MSDLRKNVAVALKTTDWGTHCGNRALR